MKTKMNIQVKTAILAIVACLARGAWAGFNMTNPVTGDTETYTYKFVGTTHIWNGTQYWQDSNGDNPSAVPGVSDRNVWDPILFDASANSINITAGLKVEGWNLRMGLYNGANVTLNNLQKLQGGIPMWITVDGTSQCTIGHMANAKLVNSSPLSLYSAKTGGIAWSEALSDSSNGNGTSMPFHYYLTGTGSVAFNGGISVTGTGAHVIKQADVTLTGTSQVSSKTLVSFTSSTKTFTADAAIKVYGTDGTTLVETVNLAEVKNASTLTTSDSVGSCELVQTSTGIVLYWVDGDPSAIVEKTYKPSININFTNGAGNGLTTSADVGLDGYAVPGTSWNNFVVANNATFSTVNAIDSTGAASVASGVSVSISGTRGHWNCANLTPASNPLHGYIDESTDYPTPTVTITGIPYEHYRVIVYHSTDTANAKFGYDTINGFNFTYVDGVQQTGTTSWGSAGASNSAEAIAEGVNTLVSAVLSGDTVTMVAHRIGGGSPSARGCFAAIQVVEYVPEVGENDLEIEVDGATNYAVDEAKTLSGTVYLTGSGTLTLTGSEKITAATIDVGSDVVLNINADRLDATTFTGSGTVVYDNTAPVTGKGWAAIGWSGTVWVKNQAVSNFNGNNFGNATSTIRFTGVTGYLSRKTTDGVTQSVPIELVDEGNTIAFTYDNGWGGNLVKINTLRGTGTLKTQGSGAGEHIYIVDASGFTGVFNLTAKSVYVGGDEPTYSDATSQSGKLEIRSGVTMTVPSSKTWTANSGFVVNGTLNVDGTLASSHTTKAVSGAGTVVFTGRAPTVSGDAWWKNADWTGTVQVKDVTNMVGDSRTGVWLKFNDYGNSGSVVEMNNVTGWLETGYTCTVPLKITGTLYLNNGGSDKANAFKVGTLLGDGTISGDGNAPRVVFNITDDWSGFTGKFGLNNKCIVFGSTIPDTLAAGTIYISEDAVVTPQQSSGTWWAVGGIKVDGELRAPNLGKFGGDTNITTSDNGVFTLTSTGNGTEDETNTDYARIQGTGSLKYEGTGWRALTTNKLSTAVTLVNEQAGDILLSRALTYNIGSLSGSKKFQGNYGSGARYLNIVQTKDTEWSGTITADGSSRLAGFSLDATSTGTLTLSGTETQSATLAVNGGSVNLTGTWVGATTVSGTLGGTGTLTGALTFSDNATFKVFGTDGADGLNVSGAVTVGDGVTVTIADGVTITEATTILTAASFTGTFALASDLQSDYTLTQSETTLTITPIDHNIYVDGDAVGYMDGTTAVVTNTAGMVTIPDNATAITVYLDGGNPSFAISTATYMTIALSGANGFTVYAKYGESVYNVTGAFPLISNPTSYTETGSGYEMTFELSASGAVTIGNEAIDVAPALRDSGMACTSVGTPTYSVKTIPGLWYAVKAADNPAMTGAASGTAVQATSATTAVTAPAFTGTVKYYKIAVGASRAALQ